MAEYIDREATLREMGEEPLIWFGDKEDVQANNDWYNYTEIVKNMPAADVVEVVRCKDCKYRGWVQEPCHGKTVHYCKLTENRVEDNNFCSYGERRSE